MKRIQIIMLLLFISPLHNAVGQQYGWVNITPNLPDFPYDTIYNQTNDTIVAGLMDLCFINDNEGWIVTANGNTQGGGAVLHTTDGGDSWVASAINTVCDAIHILNSTSGYAGGMSGIIWKTNDGGQTWTFHGTTASTINDIEFPPYPCDTGFVSGMDGYVAYITPTGITPMASGIFGHVETMSFPVSAKEGWFEGEGGGMIRHFTNGQWTADQIHISGYFNAIDFVDNNNGWAVGDRILHTIDGITWSEQTNHPTLSGALMSVFFLNLNEGWAVGTDGQVLKTIDGGISWVNENLGTNEFFTGVQFTSSTNGYLIGNNKAIYKYTQLSVIKDYESLRVMIFPNPATNTLNIECPQSQNFNLSLYNIIGEQLMHKEFKGSKETIDISALPAGMYFARITVDKQMIVKKIIKQ